MHRNVLQKIAPHGPYNASDWPGLEQCSALVHHQSTSLGMAGGAYRALSQRERAGGEGPHSVGYMPLTLTLSQRERGQETKAKKVI